MRLTMHKTIHPTNIPSVVEFVWEMQFEAMFCSNVGCFIGVIPTPSYSSWENCLLSIGCILSTDPNCCYSDVYKSEFKFELTKSQPVNIPNFEKSSIITPKT